jgi:YD repeat-containing protein
MRSQMLHCLRRLAACVACLLLIGGTASAQNTTVYSIQGQLPRASQNITALGADLMGDRSNLYNGALEFYHQDVELPGNNGLQVAVGRRFALSRDRWVQGVFGDWDLDIPHIKGSFDARFGWIAGDYSQSRCSNFGSPPTAIVNSRTFFYATEFWQGNQLHVPGEGSQEILVRNATNVAVPADGNAWPLVTAKGWRIRCLPSVYNGEGQGFLAVSPDGTQYHFNWMARRFLSPLRGPDQAALDRDEVWLMPTLIVDRFGNSVSYSYGGPTPWNLTQISSSDGRVITLSYYDEPGVPRVGSVTDGTRTWTYQYDGNRNLQRVVLPDGSAWQFNLGGLRIVNESQLGEGTTCDWMGAWPHETLSGSMTHPSGAVGYFERAFRL